MKAFILCFLISSQAMACQWSSIKQVESEFVYSRGCHIKVGKLVKTEPLQREQVKKLKESITFKDLAITQADAKSNLWQKEAEKQLSHLQKYEKNARMERIIWFTAGVASILVGSWAINQTK